MGLLNSHSNNNIPHVLLSSHTDFEICPFKCSGWWQDGNKSFGTARRTYTLENGSTTPRGTE